MAADLCPTNSKPVREEADARSLMMEGVDITMTEAKADQDVDDFAKSILRLYARIHDCQASVSINRSGLQCCDEFVFLFCVLVARTLTSRTIFEPAWRTARPRKSFR
jgi:hypothetical protein